MLLFSFVHLFASKEYSFIYSIKANEKYLDNASLSLRENSMWQNVAGKFGANLDVRRRHSWEGPYLPIDV